MSFQPKILDFSVMILWLRYKYLHNASRYCKLQCSPQIKT